MVKAGGYVSIRHDGKWHVRKYADLTEQWSTTAGSRHELFLEQMDECSPGYRVVSRASILKSRRDESCPPVISGPHDTLEAGKAAYLVALATL